MTLTPDRKHQRQSKDADSDAGQGTAGAPGVPPGAPAESGGAEVPTWKQLLEGAGLNLTDHPLAAEFDVPADPLAGDESEESPDVSADTADEGGLPNSVDERASEHTGEPPWGGRSLWDAINDDPAARAEAQRISAERDAEIRARQQQADEAARSAQVEAASGDSVWGTSRDLAEWDAEDRDAIRAEEARDDGAIGKPRPTSTPRASERHATDGPAEQHDICAAGGREVEQRTQAGAAHPLLSDEAWAHLSEFAPEVTDAITALGSLASGLHSFDRPMGPEDAVTVLDGIETIDRLTESLSAIVLSVFERCGTPRDFGAKTTKALVENRLHVSGREASRRVGLADALGKRVDFSGQSLDPKFPLVAAGLMNGTLSAIQAGIIVQCLKKLPARVGAEEREQAEKLLVEHAPGVRVRDIRVLFEEILAWADPDGDQPDETPARDEYCVNLRAREDGAWILNGLLDPVTGGIMHGLLTSRITAGAGAASTATTGSDLAAAVVEVFDAVLTGDRHDAIDPSVIGELADPEQSRGEREDGTPVPVGLELPSVRTRIYERFATLVSRIEMKRAGIGAPYALVVTAKAEDLAERTGRAETGADTAFPIATAAAEGLNGAVFFHLMSEKARTVEVQTEKRFANAKQLAILAARDQGCSFPGCDTPPGWCDAHHVVPWAEGGKTDVNNLTLACGAHHHLIDRSDWYAVMLKDGRPAWVPPTTVDPAREPILHARFIVRGIADTLFD